MKRSALLLAAPLLALGLSACETDYHGAGWYQPAAYFGWYDGFYGNVYDGYWGDDGNFYYRGNASEHEFHRGDANHFRHDQSQPGANFRQMNGNFNPRHGWLMPHYHHVSH